MAKLDYTHDTDQIPANEPFLALPPGRYEACIVKSDVKTTKEGGGRYVELQWKILDGEYVNRIVYQNCNIKNQNGEAERIGKQELSGVGLACGIVAFDDTVDLHNIAAIIVVDYQKDNREKNRIKGVLPLEAPAAAPTTPQQTRSAAPSAVTQARQTTAVRGAAAAQTDDVAAGGGRPWPRR